VDLARAARATGERRYADRFGALAASWIDGCAPGRGDGWKPYPTSLRVVNWIHALLLLGDRIEEAAAARIAASAAAQTAYLERRREYHLLGNHLLENAKALATAGLFFEGRGAGRWLRRAGCG